MDVIEDRKNGLLVNPGQVDELAAALGALLSDEDRRRGIGLAGRKSALERFDVQDSLDRYRALFRELSP